MTELYHYFKYNQNKNKFMDISGYSENYWKKVEDVSNHMKKNILSSSDYLSNIQVSEFI